MTQISNQYKKFVAALTVVWQRNKKSHIPRDFFFLGLKYFWSTTITPTITLSDISNSDRLERPYIANLLTGSQIFNHICAYPISYIIPFTVMKCTQKAEWAKHDYSASEEMYIIIQKLLLCRCWESQVVDVLPILFFLCYLCQPWEKLLSLE